MRVIVGISDLQVPYHDQAAVDAVSDWIHEVKPNEVLNVGDAIDLPQISRWTQGKAGEFTRDIGKHRDQTVEVLKQLQTTGMVRSNHTDRLLTSVATRLPGFLGLPELQLENFLRLPELGITYYPGMHKFAPGWLLAHGDEGRASQVGGMTALKLSDRTGYSMLTGHTHRLGLVPSTESFNGKITKTRFGFEVGNLIKQGSKGMGYTGGIANWQQGFGVLLVEGSTVLPIPVPIINRRFNALGVERKW
jgi:hypothetical protein